MFNISSPNEINKMQISLDSGINQYNNVMGNVIGDYAKKTLQGGSKILTSGGIKLTSEGIKSARNFIMPALKFKPWGAVKLAGNINKALPVIGQIIGIGIELWDSYTQKKKEEEFQEGINNLVSTFENQRKEYLEFINNEDKFTSECFPNYIGLKDQLKELQTELDKKQKQHENFKRWREQGEAIEAEFKIIS